MFVGRRSDSVGRRPFHIAQAADVLRSWPFYQIFDSRKCAHRSEFHKQSLVGKSDGGVWISSARWVGGVGRVESCGERGELRCGLERWKCLENGCANAFLSNYSFRNGMTHDTRARINKYL